jgi:cold shock protein
MARPFEELVSHLTDNGTAGTVAWYCPNKGYGFLALEDGGGDAFFADIEVAKSGLKPPQKGDRLRCDLVPGRAGKRKAINLKAVTG